MQDRDKELFKLATDAAKRVAFQWPDHVGVDDLTQDMLFHLLESPGTVERLFDEDLGVQRAFLVKLGHQIASDTQVDYDRFSGNYLYDTGEVRGMLERQIWYSTIDQWRPEISDLTSGLATLKQSNSNYWAVLMARYEQEIVPDHDDATGKRKIRRAVAALTRKMNYAGRDRERLRIEGPGTRKCASNLACQSLTDREAGFTDAQYL